MAEIRSFARPSGHTSVKAGVEISKGRAATDWHSVAHYLKASLARTLGVCEVAPEDRELTGLLRLRKLSTSERRFCMLKRCPGFLEVDIVCHPGSSAFHRSRAMR